MAPPPPPSINLLRALRALTAVRPILPIHSRRSLSYKPSTIHTPAYTRQHIFHRKLHLPSAIFNYHPSQILSRDRLRNPTLPSPLSQRPKPTLPAPSILPSPHLLARRFHTSRQTLASDPPPPPPSGLANAPSAPTSLTRGPISKEATQTNFSTMDMLSSAPAPASSIDACLSTGFHLSNGVKIHNAGVLIVSGEAFAWTPWATSTSSSSKTLLNAHGQWNANGVDDSDAGGGWGLLDLVWPKPDLLILGLGPQMYPLAAGTRKCLHGLGIRVEVQDTRNAAAQYNLLATERGVGSVATALIPVGWREGRGL